MDVFLSLKSHANSVCLPLRLGVRITAPHQQFAHLESARLDEAGSRSQRQNEIDEGRKHYLGTLVIPHDSASEGVPYKLPCRIVLGPPSRSDQRPTVITVLREDNNKGDLTVTRHIEGMLKRGKITEEEVIRVFHPAYINGEIRDSNDCEEIFDRYRKTLVEPITANNPTARALLNDPESVVDAIEEVASNDAALKAPLSYTPLSVPDVKYKYVLVDAYLADVWMDGDVIMAKFINSRGKEQTCHSFKPREHLVEHHRRTFAYLKERKEQRAVFALCDSEPCRGFLAETVTSIALQLMRTRAGTVLSTDGGGAVERRGQSGQAIECP